MEEKKANIEIVVAVMNTLCNLHFPVSAILNGDESINAIVGCCRALHGFVVDYKAEEAARSAQDSATNPSEAGAEESNAEDEA